MEVELNGFDEDKEWEEEDVNNDDTCMDSEFDELEDSECSKKEEGFLINPKEYTIALFDTMFNLMYENDESFSKLSDSEIINNINEFMESLVQNPTGAFSSKEGHMEMFS